MRRKPVSQRLAVQRARSARRREPQRPIARVRAASGAAANVDRAARASKAPRESGRLARFVSGIDWGRVRLISVGALFAVLGAALWLRAGQVQILDGPRLSEMARRQHVRTEMVVGRRGDITDRNGLVLASTLESRSIFVRPPEVQDLDETARVLSGILGMPQNNVRKLLAEKKSFVWIARKVGDRTAAAVSEAALRGIYLTTEYERIYPYREMAGQVLGFVNVDGQGLEGIEKAFDEQLAGGTAKITVQRDASGRRFYPGTAVTQDELDGRPVRLTIDMQIQHIAEQGLATAVQKYNAAWGGCIVVDVPTGEVLAWAHYPPFNPNRYTEYLPHQWRNRLALDAIEPGSTLKPLVVAAALEEGAATLESIYDCEKGRWRVAGTTIRDTSPRGELTLAEVVRYSSNIGMAKIGLELGARRSWAYFTRYGFGARTGLPVAESKGILRDPAQWAEIDTASVAFGQSLSVTGAQMAKAYLALANRGETKPLRLIMNDPVAEHQTLLSQRVFSVETANQVLEIMREAVQGDGSGRRARITGVQVGGKTGTAQKADGSGTYGEGRLASFVGIVPVEEPRFLVLTMVDEPKNEVYGGVVAAPVFQQVTSKLLAYRGLLPDPEAPVAVPVIASAGTAAPGAAENPASAQASPAAAANAAPAAVQTAQATTPASPAPVAERPPLPSITPGVMPNVVGQSVRRAVEIMAATGVVPRILGAGPVVVQQEPPAGSSWENDDNGERAPVILWLSEHS